MGGKGKFVLLGGAIIVLIIIVGVCLASSGGIISSNSQFTIVVSCPGQQFSGSYDVMKSDGSSVGKTVDGYGLAYYYAEGTIISAVFQKQGIDGTLSVQIQKDGNIVKSSETTAAYGVVSVATQ